MDRSNRKSIRPFELDTINQLDIMDSYRQLYTTVAEYTIHSSQNHMEHSPTHYTGGPQSTP